MRQNEASVALLTVEVLILLSVAVILGKEVYSEMPKAGSVETVCGGAECGWQFGGTFVDAVGHLGFALLSLQIAFFLGILPIPIGYNRGKIKWLSWCGTGMHAHVVYWHTEEDGRNDWRGFQSIHPKDVAGGED